MQANEQTVDDFIDELTIRLSQNKFNFAKCATADRNGKPLVFHKYDVAAALLETNGVLSKAAELLNVRRCKLEVYVHSNIDILDLKEDLRQARIDLVEEEQFNLAIVDKDGAAGRFILQTVGRNRGYTKTMEIKGGHGPKPQVHEGQSLVEKAKAFKDRILQTHGV